MLFLLGSLGACESTPRGAAGESCTKRADCEDGLRCVEQICVGEDDGAPGVEPAPAQGAEQEAVVAEVTAAEEQPSDGASPEGESPSVDPAGGLAPSASGVSATALTGLKSAKGPFSSIDEFCRPHRENFMCGPDQVPGKGSKRKDIPGLGTVQLVGMGDSTVMTEVSLSFSTPKGVYVAERLVVESVGSEVTEFLEESRITSDTRPGVVGLEFRKKVYERVDDGSGKAGYQMEKSETDVTVRYSCGVDASGVPGCTRPKKTKRVISDGRKKSTNKKSQSSAKTGVAECDELWRRSMACYDKMGDAGRNAKKAFQDGAKAWRDLAKNPNTRDQAKDACKQALVAAEAGWKAAGC